MGYFDGLTDSVFKKNALGDTLFYPRGILGSGFIIDSEDKKNQIRGFYKKSLMVMLTTCIFIQIAVGFWLNLVFLTVFEVWYYFMAKKITKDLSKTEEKMKFFESSANSAKSHKLPILILLELSSLGFVAAGIWLLQVGKSSAIALASIVFFGLCAIDIGYMILIKIKNK